jgi:3-oxoacyl-[acyl-carrier-protein] synthase-3
MTAIERERHYNSGWRLALSDFFTVFHPSLTARDRAPPYNRQRNRTMRDRGPAPYVGLSGVSAALPRAARDIEALAAGGLLESRPAALRDLGFARAYVAGTEDEEAPHALACEAARAALDDAGLQPKNVDLLIWAGARPESHVKPRAATEAGAADGVFDSFRYVSGWLQEQLGLDNAEVLATAQQGCATMFSALRTARAILLAEPGRRHALCVGADALPRGARREILYNVISDAACAVVVSRECAQDRWIGYRQISRGYYWDPVERRHEIAAAYFPLAKRTIDDLLEAHDLRPQDIDVVVPTGVSRASWEILLRLVGIPGERMRGAPEPYGHTILADSFIHLQHLRKSAALARGARVLMFTYGFGSSWCALLLEH